MRILIFGGSFDPPHKGHAKLLARAARRVGPSSILILPAHQAPLKGLPCAPAADRVKMIRIGLMDALPSRKRSVCRIDLHEIRSGRRVFTVESLRRIKRRHPRARLHFAVGSDSAASFDDWKRPGELKRLAAWWTAARPRGRRRIPPHFRRIKGRFPDVSSTEIREALAFGETPGELSPGVLAHIRRRGLYGLALAEKVRSRLGRKRFAHTTQVARQALRLARRHGLDAQRALTAALLHDLGRSVPVGAMGGYAARRGIKVPALARTAREHPLLLHSYISADMARRFFKIKDRRILNAIRRHTLGAPGMSPLDRLIYVADATSDDRSYPGLARLRRLAERDLDRAFRLAVSRTLAYVRRSKSWVHPLTAALWRQIR